MTHKEIWKMIDLLAESKGMTAFRLAKISGIDSTAFNPSKRVFKKGKRKEHWPTMETIAKILAATGTDFLEFAKLYEKAKKS